WTQTEIPGLPALGALAIADVEADGYPDVYSFGVESPVFLALNYGDTWSEAIYVTDTARSLGVGDLDDDGFEGAVVYNYGATAVTGGGAFQDVQLVSGGGAASIATVAVGDFDGSGVPDVLALAAGPDNTSIVSAWQAPVLQTIASLTWWSMPGEL